MTPINQEVLGWKMYPMHAGFCVLSFLLVYFAYPESTPWRALLCASCVRNVNACCVLAARGVPLEEMGEIF